MQIELNGIGFLAARRTFERGELELFLSAESRTQEGIAGPARLAIGQIGLTFQPLSRSERRDRSERRTDSEAPEPRDPLEGLRDWDEGT